jgi:hypothetical protein
VSERANRIDPELMPGDPHIVPLVVVDGIVSCSLRASGISLVLFTDRTRIDEDNFIRPDNIICARLRLTPEVARSIRDCLDAQIELAKAPTAFQAAGAPKLHRPG